MELKKNQVIIRYTTFLGVDDLFLLTKIKNGKGYIIKEETNITPSQCIELTRGARVDFKSKSTTAYCHPDVRFKEEWNKIPTNQKTQGLY